MDKEAERILREVDTPDMPIDQAAVSTTSLLDYMVSTSSNYGRGMPIIDPHNQLHATDEEGRKMDVELVHQNVLTFLGAGQVTTSSALAWVSPQCPAFRLSIDAGDAAMVLPRYVPGAGAEIICFPHCRRFAQG